MDKIEIKKLLKPDKMKIGFFIGLILLILILPVFPCQVDRTVRIGTQSLYYGFNNTTQDYSSYSLEFFLSVANENYEWDEYYIKYSGSVAVNNDRQTIEVWEDYTSTDYSFAIFASYFIIAYVISCSLAFYGRDEYQGVYLSKKLKKENRAISSSKYKNCIDCGVQVPVLSDGSGICPECKRSYMDENSWKTKSGHIPSTAAVDKSLQMDIDVKHWDKYQEDVDAACNDEKLFRFSPLLIIFTIVVSILFMASSIIITYSEIKYNSSGIAELHITGALVLNWVVSALSGFYLGRHIKRANFGVPIIILCTLIAICAGLIYGETLFSAVHPDIWVRFVVELFNTTFICLVASMVSFSRYHYGQD